MQKPGSGSASTLGLLSKHRQARELLARSNSIFDEGQAPGAGLPPRMARPQSASSLLGERLSSFSSGTGSGSATFTATRRPRSATVGREAQGMSPGVASAASRHFHASPLQSSGLGSSAAAAASSTTARRRPLSACAATGSVSPVGGRPGSATGLRERLARPASAGATSSWYCPQAAAMVRERQHQAVQQSIQSHREQYPLPPQSSLSQPGSLSPKSARSTGLEVPESRTPYASHEMPQARYPPPEPARVLPNSTSTSTPAVPASDLPSQGPPLLASLSQSRPGSAAPKIGGVAPPLPPLPPELEVERALATRDVKVPSEAQSLEAICDGEKRTEGEDDAENSGFDQTFTAEELRLEQAFEEALAQLEAIDAAVEALRLQLEVARDDIESSKSELAQLRSAADSWIQAAEEGTRELKDREQRLNELLGVLPAEDEEPATARCEEQDSRQSQLAAERLKVVEVQMERLQDQVISQQRLLEQRLEERRALEAQVEASVQDRDAQRAAQQEARGGLRAMEQQLKSREEASAASAQRRQYLERQAVRLRGEARGIKARLQAQPEQTMKPQAQAPEKESPDAKSDSNGESSHACSLKLQHEVVGLWAAIKRCDEEAAELEAALQEADSQEALSEMRALLPQAS